MYEVYERYKTFRKIHFTLKKIGFSFAMAAIISLVYLNYILISDYNALKNNQRNVSAQDESLRTLADKRGFQIGAAALTNPTNYPDPKYSQILSSEFNRLELEGFSYKYTEPSQGNFSFQGTDNMVDYGMQNNMKIEGHHLAWGAYENIPDWLKNGTFTRDELINILHTHITTVVTRYRGKIDTWSVTNEWASRYKWQGADFWNDKIGPEYLEMVFNWAHEADQDAVMMFNQAGNEDKVTTYHQQISDDTYSKVQELKQKGVPVDAIGMQMHIMSPYSVSPSNPNNGDLPKKEDIINNMKWFAGLGVKIYVTEFDVNMSNQKWGTTTDERWANEGNIYKDMLGACLESGVCNSFTTFGFTDSVTWYNDCAGCLNIANSDPLPYDKTLQPKPAYYAMRDTLILPPAPPPSSPPVSSSPLPSSQNSPVSGSTQGGQTQNNGSSSAESTTPEEKRPSTAIEKIADRAGKIFDAPNKLMKSMPLWQQQVILAILLTLLVVEMVVIDKFTHVSMWLLYLYRHYIRRVY